MGILMGTILLLGAFLSGAALQDGAGQDPGAPEFHAVPEPAPGAGDVTPLMPLDCRARRPRVIYRDLSRAPVHTTGSATPAGACTSACADD